MLSPLLEQLVLSNQATVKTHNHGVGGVGTINVSPGKKIIITQIIWHPFIDVNGMKVLQEDLFDESGSFLHTLKLRNKSNRYAYSFRDTFTPILYKPKGGGDVKTFLAPAEPKIIDVYLPFTEGNVDIDITKFTNFSSWVVNRDYLAGSTVEPEPAEGYGNANTILKNKPVLSVGYYGFAPPPWSPSFFCPPSVLRSFGNIPAPFSTDEFEGQLPLTAPPNVATEPAPQNTDIIMFPMITFTYIEINTRYVPGEIGNINFKK